MFKKSFLGTTQFGGAQKIFAWHCSWMPSRGYRPDWN